MLYIKHDGKLKATVKDADAAVAWLLRHQGQSAHYALRYGGWSVEDSKGIKPLAGYIQPSLPLSRRKRRK